MLETKVSYYSKGWMAGMLTAARLIEEHWNDSTAQVNQREQAERSAAVLRKAVADLEQPFATARTPDL